jgi:hypothetical protein
MFVTVPIFGPSMASMLPLIFLALSAGAVGEDGMGKAPDTLF